MENSNLRIYIPMLVIGIIIISGLAYIGFLNPKSLQSNAPQDIPFTQFQKNADEFQLSFNGTKAWKHLEDQVNIGFRFPNSTEINLTRSYIVSILEEYNWIVNFHNFTYNGIFSTNILAFPHSSDKNNVTLFGAHYDTRWKADRDPVSENRQNPVLGANDGASGIAVLLEFADIFKDESDIGLLFIDAEDQGGINGWNYIAGSTEFAKEENLNIFFPNGKNSIKQFILLDMIGDWNLNIKKELRSTTTIINEIWESAETLNYSTYFVPKPGYSMTDDHVPFLNMGIPAVDLIDFDYVDEDNKNLHHTVNDNLNYVREQSLWIVGQTVEFWFKG